MNSKESNRPTTINLSRDLATINGGLVFESDTSVSLDTVHWTASKELAKKRRSDRSSWMVQGLLPKTLSTRPQIGNSFVAAAGVIWKLPKGCPFSLAGFESILRNAVEGENYRELMDVRGDFVAVLLCKNSVVLLRSCRATTMLFYRISNSNVEWATDFSAMVESPISCLDYKKLAKLSWGADVVPYEDVHSLPTGILLTVRAGRMNTLEYSKTKTQIAMPTDCGGWSEEVRHRIKEAVALRARRYGRIGLLLSGGIDSSAIGWCLKEIGADVLCIHWDSQEFSPADESGYARAVSKSLGFPLLSIPIGDLYRRNSLFIDQDWKFSFPYNHGLYKWWYETAIAVRGEVDCLMSGLAGDSTFGTSSIKNALKGIGAIPLRDAVSYFVNLLSINEGISDFFRESQRHRDISPYRQLDHLSPWAASAVKESVKPTDLSGFLQAPSLDYNAFFPSGLRHVGPYLDEDLNAFCQVIPSPYKLAPFRGQLIDKVLLRYAFIDRLPLEVVRRNYRQYVSGLIQGYCENNPQVIKQLLGEESWLNRFGIVNQDNLRKVLSNERLLGTHSNTLIINSMIELWLRNIL